MEDRTKKAVELFKNGYNCAQSVFVAFSDLYNINDETALKLSTPFGGGLAGTRNICGAVSAMAMIAGLETGTSIPKDKEGKLANYAYVNSLIDKFQQEHGTVQCKYLMGLEKPEVPVKRKKCYEYVEYCASLLESNLKNKDEK